MSDYGRLIRPDTLEFQRNFDAPSEKVWQFLVDPEKRKLWFCGGATDAHAGGQIVFEFDHRRLSESAPPAKYASEEVVTHQGEITEYEAPSRLAFTWFENGHEGHSQVEITLTSRDDGTTDLHLIHRGLIGREIIIGVLAGWHGHFDLLAEVLAGGRKSDFWILDQQLEAEYAQRAL